MCCARWVEMADFDMKTLAYYFSFFVYVFFLVLVTLLLFLSVLPSPCLQLCYPYDPFNRRKGVPFRETHHISGAAVKMSEDRGVPLDSLTPSDLRTLHSAFEDDVHDVWNYETRSVFSPSFLFVCLVLFVSLVFGYFVTNKALMATLIDADMKEYCQRLFAAAVPVAKDLPPGIENMPGVVFPTWPALTNYIRGGGLLGAAASPMAGAGRAEKRSRQTPGGGSGFGDCFAWEEVRGCRFGEKCVYAHHASKKYRPDTGRGGTSGRASNGNGNGRTGGGGGSSSVGRGRDSRPKQGGGPSASRGSGGGSAADRAGVASVAAPPWRG